jgi:hypothetical protein
LISLVHQNLGDANVWFVAKKLVHRTSQLDLTVEDVNIVRELKREKVIEQMKMMQSRL